VFGLRSVIAVWAGAAAPMAPLVASVVTAEELLRRIVNTVVHGLPL